MYCNNPTTLYRDFTTGKVSMKQQYRHQLPIKKQGTCKKCWKCRAREAREWAVRIHHEALTHQENSFITLTYNDQNLPINESLSKRDVQTFMKQLRKLKAFENIKIRYFAAGEYGKENNRPHYHIVLFGVNFPDKTKWRKSKKGYIIYRSKLLERAWTKGHSELGTVTINSSKYTANYVTQKVNGHKKETHYGKRIPEYSTMSRNPPLGYQYYMANLDEITVQGAVQYLDKHIPIPRTYKRTMQKLGLGKISYKIINQQ